MRPENSKLIAVIRRVLRDPIVAGATVVLYEKPGATFEELPRYSMELAEFETRLARHYTISGMPKNTSADAVIDIVKD